MPKASFTLHDELRRAEPFLSERIDCWVFGFTRQPTADVVPQYVRTSVELTFQ